VILMADYLLFDGRACSLDLAGIEAASLILAMGAESDGAAIRECEEVLREHAWALFRARMSGPVVLGYTPIACSNEDGIYWTGEGEELVPEEEQP
jgi:hypothetical protein